MKKAPAKKTAGKKTAVKKAPAKKTAGKKTAAKKTPAKKAAAKKTAAKKTAAKKTAAKKTAVKKAAAKKAAKTKPAKRASSTGAGLGREGFLEALAGIAADHWKYVDAWFAENDPGTDYREEPPQEPLDESAALAAWEAEYGEAFDDSSHVHFRRFAHRGRTFMEYTLLAAEVAHRRWRGLNELAEQGVFKNRKPRALDRSNDAIRFVWWSRGFIPVAEDGGGNLICVDLDPGPGGKRGQVIRWDKTEGPFGPIDESIGIHLANYRHALAKGEIYFDQYGMLERRTVRDKGTKAEEELFAAVEAGDAATVSRLLAADKSLLEVRNQYKEPLIIPAMQKKHTAVVEAFLDAGVDPNSRGPSGNRILGYALSAAAAGSVALLLERGAVPENEKYGSPESIIAATLSGWSSSEDATEADYVSMVESLLAAGADPNEPWYGETPLMKAAEYGSMTLVKQLIAAGARIDAVDDKRKDAAAYARSKRHKEVEAYLKSLAAS